MDVLPEIYDRLSGLVVEQIEWYGRKYTPRHSLLGKNSEIDKQKKNMEQNLWPWARFLLFHSNNREGEVESILQEIHAAQVRFEVLRFGSRQPLLETNQPL